MVFGFDKGYDLLLKFTDPRGPPHVCGRGCGPHSHCAEEPKDGRVAVWGLQLDPASTRATETSLHTPDIFHSLEWSVWPCVYTFTMCACWFCVNVCIFKNRTS